MNVLELETCLKLIQVLEQKEFASNEQEIREMLVFVEEFYQHYEAESAKLPYHFNLIDELGANENAHSRILVKLLQYKRDNMAVFLQHFINFIKEKNKDSFEFEHSLENCTITFNKELIDAFILGQKFAIIIENKIHYAKDQPKQIENYIEKAKRKVSENEIYVIYLTREGGTPNPESFSEEKKNDFIKRKRYTEMSYRYDILSWLENFDLSLLKTDEIYIQSALYQYIDHLKGMFYLRNTQTTMNTELLNTLRKQLSLGNDSVANIEKIKSAIHSLDKTRGYLNEALQESCLNCFKDYYKELEKDYPKCEIFYSFKESYPKPKCGVVLTYKNIKFSILIEYWTENTTPYFGIGRHCATEAKNAEIENMLKNKPNLSFKDFSEWWYGWKFTKYEDVYEEFKNLLEEVLKIEGVEFAG